MKDVLLLKNKSLSIGLSFDDITARLDAKKLSYDVYENEIPTEIIPSYKSCILYGTSASLNLSDFKDNLGYIPDPDLNPNDINDIDHLLKSLKDKEVSFKEQFPTASVFSLFSSDFPESFNFLTQDREKSIKPFNLCLIADDSYKSILPQILLKESSVMLIYIGTNNIECEEEIDRLWEKYPNLSLSTFQEPASFMHANLAKEVLVELESKDLNTEIQILRELKYSGINLATSKKELLKLPVFKAYIF